MPATPMPLLVAAAMVPATCVPCHELSSTPQPANVPEASSVAVIQSPGSLGSASRAPPSLAMAELLMKS